MHAVFQRAKKTPGALLRASDFRGFEASAITVALHRLTNQGILKRATKGYYYYPKQTLLGPSQPSGLAIDLEVI